MGHGKLDIKTVDLTILSNPNAFSEAACLVRNECIKTGFFLLKVPCNVAEQMQNVLKATKEFFELPLEEKQKMKNNEFGQHRINGKIIPGTGAGYRGFSEDPNFAMDTRESYNMGCDVPRDVCISDGYSGIGMTPWPGDDVLPGWRETMESYSQALLKISCTLRQLIAASLGLDKEFFEGPGYFDRATWLLGLVHYAALKSDEGKQIFGIKPHCDGSMFTLLLGDGSPGLQVCLDKTVKYNDRVWLDIEPPPPGHLIVNLGQILERWTDGLFKATMHRVMLSGKTERWSVPFFYEPNIDCVIKPLVDSSPNGWSYPITTPGEIFLERQNKNLDDFE